MNEQHSSVMANDHKTSAWWLTIWLLVSNVSLQSSILSIFPLRQPRENWAFKHYQRRLIYGFVSIILGDGITHTLGLGGRIETETARRAASKHRHGLMKRFSQGIRRIQFQFTVILDLWERKTQLWPTETKRINQ